MKLLLCEIIWNHSMFPGVAKLGNKKLSIEFFLRTNFQRIASGSSRRGSAVGLNSTAPGRMDSLGVNAGGANGPPSREGSGNSGRNARGGSSKRGGMGSTVPLSGAGSFEDPTLARLGSGGSRGLQAPEMSVNDEDARINFQERPKTAARKPIKQEDEFADEELGDDLLPE